MLASPPLTLINGASAVRIELIRRLTQRSPNPQIAMVLSRQGPLTPDRSAVHRRAGRRVRERANIPAATRTKPGDVGGVDRRRDSPARRLHADHPAPLCRGTASRRADRSHAPWRIGLTLEVRGRFAPEVPGDYVKLDDTRRQLSVARETMLNQVRAGRHNAVYAVQGKRRGRRIEIHPGEQRGCRAPSSHALVAPLNVVSVKHPVVSRSAALTSCRWTSGACRRP